jgi:hypothetical protein
VPDWAQAFFVDMVRFWVRAREGSRRLFGGRHNLRESRNPTETSNRLAISTGERDGGVVGTTPPIRTVTQSGAQVGPHRCPILQTGIGRITTTASTTSNSWRCRWQQRTLLGLALSRTMRMGDFELFSRLCYRAASRLEEVLSTRCHGRCLDHRLSRRSPLEKR